MGTARRRRAPSTSRHSPARAARIAASARWGAKLRPITIRGKARRRKPHGREKPQHRANRHLPCPAVARWQNCGSGLLKTAPCRALADQDVAPAGTSIGLKPCSMRSQLGSLEGATGSSTPSGLAAASPEEAAGVFRSFIGVPPDSLTVMPFNFSGYFPTGLIQVNTRRAILDSIKQM